MEPRLRPKDFASAMCNQLPFFKSEEDKQMSIDKMANSILDQIQAHIDKNTFFPRVRFCRKDEEMIANDQVCVSCDSLLNNPDVCVHCGFQYERKPGPQSNNAQPNSIISDKAVSSANINDNQRKSGIAVPALINQSSIFQAQNSMMSLESPMNNLAKEFDEFQVPARRSIQPSHQVLIEEEEKQGKEKKICKKCNTVNSFFKNECTQCSYKFPKTRGNHSSLNSDNYTLYFWDMLHSDPLFSSLNRINDYLEESDFISLRDLYKKIKEILSQPNTERIFDITDSQLLELHDSIDEKFEVLVTDNDLTDRIFNDATSMKTNRKRLRQTYLNFKEAQSIHNRKMTGQEEQLIQEQMDDQHFGQALAKRRKLGMTASIAKNRPHSFGSVQMHNIIQNYGLLSQMGFLEQKVIQNEQINKIIGERDFSTVGQSKKRGRPKKFDITYEDMLNVETWDDSKLVFQSGIQGLSGQADQEDPNQDLNNQTTGNPSAKGKGQYDGNADVCGVCMNPGKLICCDDCPSAFHAQCLGYEKQCPRGKWKCYFCKVTKYGIRQVPRMAPNEKPICDELGDNLSTWEEKALQMLDILREYFCMQVFFDKIEWTQEQLDTLKKKKVFDAEVDEGLPTLQEIYQRVEVNEVTKEFLNHEHFSDEIKSILNLYLKGLDKKDIISLQAKASLLLIEKLIDENQIFKYVKASKKKQPWRIQGKRQDSVGGSPSKSNNLGNIDDSLQISLDDEEEERNKQSDSDEEEENEEMEEQEKSSSGESDFEVRLDKSTENRLNIKTRRTLQQKEESQEHGQESNLLKQNSENNIISQQIAKSTPGRVTRNSLRNQQQNE